MIMTFGKFQGQDIDTLLEPDEKGKDKKWYFNFLLKKEFFHEKYPEIAEFVMDRLGTKRSDYEPLEESDPNWKNKKPYTPKKQLDIKKGEIARPEPEFKCDKETDDRIMF